MSKGFLKSCAISACFLVISISLWAQRAVPADYSFQRDNLVRTWTTTSPQQDPNTLMTKPLADVKQVTQYFDGLGRPLQTVSKQASLAGTNAVDLVAAIEYDEFGRAKHNYLPFAANGDGGNTSINDGLFKLNPFEQQKAFYENVNGVLKGQGETWFYGQANFEASPLNRVLENYAPGNSWVGSQSNTEPNRRNVTVEYLHNDGDDQVRVWAVNGNSFSSSGTYSAAMLFETVTTDEHKHKTVEYKDKDGLVILKKVQLSATPSAHHNGWLCTYYIYDEYNLLRGVLQPRAVELLAGSGWTMTTDILEELTFRYLYDERGRMVVKKVPGAAEVYMVYDERDRLVLTQDGNLRLTNKWIYTKYDVLNRPVITGFYTGPTGYSQQQMADHVKQSLSDFYEDRSSASFVGYTLTQSFPSSTTNDVLTITYYDDYNWSGWFGTQYGSKDNGYDTHFSTNYTASPYPQPLTQTSHSKGLVTGTWTKVLGTTSTGLVKALFYDDEGRIIQSKSSNLAGGTDVLTTQYSFSGQVLHTYLYQDKPGTNAQTHSLQTKLEYDNAGRLTEVKNKLTTSLFTQSPDPGFKTIASVKYDAFGRVTEKALAPGFKGTELEKLVHDYNIRGWLLGVNREYAKSSTNTNKFGFDLGYDKVAVNTGGTYAAAAYDGNIAGMVWKSAGDQDIRKYDFTYDASNRLTSADFNQYTGSGFDKTAGLDFSLSNLTYDANGNILTMQQKGWKITGSGLIDNLQYHYRLNGQSNQLLNVYDISGNSTVLGDFKTSQHHTQSKTATTVDYTYDVNGNLTKDFNKDISSQGGDAISYNHLNLPQSLLLNPQGGSDKGSITYTYDATGSKLRKTVIDKTVSGKTITTVTNYIGGFVYESKTTMPANTNDPDYTDVLQFVMNEEGRIRLEKATNATCTAKTARFVYDYFVRDHLGNVRMVLTEQDESLCYPWATLEDGLVSTEDDYYNIVTGRIEDASTIFPSTPPGDVDDKMYRVNGGTPGEETGLGIVLKVMAGDKVAVRAQSYYEIPGGGVGNTTNLAVEDLLLSLLGSAGFPTGKGLSATDITNIGVNASALPEFINSNDAGSGKPKAFVTWILFDDRMKYVTGGADPVGNDAELKTHDYFLNNPVIASKSGYIYIYVSNESAMNVYFDNLTVTHTPGPLLEETHYYPFGLAMNAISSVAMVFSRIDNVKKYNSIEYENAFDINIGEAFYRTHDPQIGRWWQIDPKVQSYDAVTPYNAMGNNPIAFSDPLGDSTIPNAGFWINLAVGVYDGWKSTKSFAKSLTTVDGWKQVGQGVVEMQPLTNLYHMVRGEDGAFVSMGKSAVDYTAELPNMTADKAGHDLGFAVEKVVEGVALTKGIGLAKNTIASFNLKNLSRAASTTEAAKKSTTVLGHYPEYVNLAETIGARRFQIPTNVWNKMTATEQWAANTKFLDRMIVRGDNIRLATPLSQVRPGSFFHRELSYLFSKGYKVSSDGHWLIK
jgi:RHS repeat-associated protein